MLDEFDRLDRVGLVEEVEMSGAVGEAASKRQETVVIDKLNYDVTAA